MGRVLVVYDNYLRDYPYWISVSLACCIYAYVPIMVSCVSTICVCHGRHDLRVCAVFVCATYFCVSAILCASSYVRP